MSMPNIPQYISFGLFHKTIFGIIYSVLHQVLTQVASLGALIMPKNVLWN
jgi:hypothetical protein